MYKCSKCGKLKESTEFSPQTDRTGLQRSWCKECCNNVAKEYRKHHKLESKAKGAINQHRVRGHIVKFTYAWLMKKFNSSSYCPVCNTKFSAIGVKRNNATMTLDRKDNSDVLTKSNVWIICDLCNKTKQDRTVEEFIAYCKMVLERLGNF